MFHPSIHPFESISMHKWNQTKKCFLPTSSCFLWIFLMIPEFLSCWVDSLLQADSEFSSLPLFFFSSLFANFTTIPLYNQCIFRAYQSDPEARMEHTQHTQLNIDRLIKGFQFLESSHPVFAVMSGSFDLGETPASASASITEDSEEPDAKGKLTLVRFHPISFFSLFVHSFIHCVRSVYIFPWRPQECTPFMTTSIMMV